MTDLIFLWGCLVAAFLTGVLCANPILTRLLIKGVQINREGQRLLANMQRQRDEALAFLEESVHVLEAVREEMATEGKE